jgi:hypothetical protein
MIKIGGHQGDTLSLEIDGESVLLISKDLDYKREYKTNLSAEILKNNSHVRVFFNAKNLIKISTIMNDDELKFSLRSQVESALINSTGLIMPEKITLW